ncbi:MAG TPA: LysM domain-containing protein [Opitutales bacterium]|nr:LysM domain-containing protein [Opitutales bacterium]
MDEIDAKRRGSSLSGSAGSLSSPVLPSADSPSAVSKGMVMLALGIGAFGAIAGITGIVMANGASSDATELRIKVDKTQDPMTVLKPKLDEFDQRISSLSAESARDVNAIRDINTKIQQLAQALSQDREQINRNTSALAGRRAPAQVARPAAETAAPTATVDASGKKVHAIQAGDTFSSLSKQYGVSVASIQEANPGVDSSHLKIGQQVVIPVPAETK